ncbi:MAG: hypothetical protein ACI3WR_04010 [Oscillospiraceae bacterium]
MDTEKNITASYGSTLRGFWVWSAVEGGYRAALGLYACASSDSQIWWSATVRRLIPSFLTVMLLIAACVLLHRGAESRVPRCLAGGALLLAVLGALCTVCGMVFWTRELPRLCLACSALQIPLGILLAVLCGLAMKKSAVPPVWEERAEKLLQREEENRRRGREQ